MADGAGDRSGARNVARGPQCCNATIVVVDHGRPAHIAVWEPAQRTRVHSRLAVREGPSSTDHRAHWTCVAMMDREGTPTMNLVTRIMGHLQRRAVARRTARALGRCSDRTLGDLGVERAEIGRIARLAAAAPQGTPLAVLRASLEPSRTAAEQAGALVNALRARIASVERPESALRVELAR